MAETRRVSTPNPVTGTPGTPGTSAILEANNAAQLVRAWERTEELRAWGRVAGPVLRCRRCGRLDLALNSRSRCWVCEEILFGEE